MAWVLVKLSLLWPKTKGKANVAGGPLLLTRSDLVSGKGVDLTLASKSKHQTACQSFLIKSKV